MKKNNKVGAFKYKKVFHVNRTSSFKVVAVLTILEKKVKTSLEFLFYFIKTLRQVLNIQKSNKIFKLELYSNRST